MDYRYGMKLYQEGIGFIIEKIQSIKKILFYNLVRYLFWEYDIVKTGFSKKKGVPK